VQSFNPKRKSEKKLFALKMVLKYLLLVNKQGQTRLSQYFGEYMSVEQRRRLEQDIVRKCLSRSERQCSFLEYRDHKVVYRRYASLFFIVGVDRSEVCFEKRRKAEKRKKEKKKKLINEFFLCRMNLACWSLYICSLKRTMPILRMCASWTLCSTWKRRT
jgi:AP-4 complex subunit sigma-1